MADTEREAFEAMIVPAWSRETYVDGDGDLQYAEDWMQGAWVGWNMARAALASRPAEVDDEGLRFLDWCRQHRKSWIQTWRRELPAAPSHTTNKEK